MKIIDLEFEGLKLIQLDVYKDSRGFFLERFNERKFKDIGLSLDFTQDNHSYSKPKVLRGLHFQFEPQQEKLVGVIRGAIMDVVVDLRHRSKTFLKYMSVPLTGDSGQLLLIPKGMAHGFCVVGDQPADVSYKVTANYNPQGENGILWNDLDLKIKWPLENPIVSDKDKNLPTLKEFLNLAEANPKYRF